MPSTLVNPSYFEGDVMKVVLTDEDMDEPVTFQIHKQLLSSLSPYFRALPNFSEGQTNTVELTGVCPEAFRYVVNWMYSRRLPIENNADFGSMLVRAWAIADGLMMTECKDNIVDRLRMYWDRFASNNIDLQQIDDLGLSRRHGVARAMKDQWILEMVEGVIDTLDLMTGVRKLLDQNTEFSKDVVASLIYRFVQHLDDSK